MRESVPDWVKTTTAAAAAEADAAVKRAAAVSWSRVSTTVKVVAYVLPLLVAVVSAWAISSANANALQASVDRLRAGQDSQAIRLATVEAATIRLTAESTARDVAAGEVKVETRALTETVQSLRETVAELRGTLQAWSEEIKAARRATPPR